METAAATPMITIDGSHGEGGGQILRNACTYAAILRQTVRITNIRAGRKTPGLRPQHLVGLRLLEAASGGCIKEGNRVGATELLFVGGKNSENHDHQQREYVGDTQTAGSVCLLMQTILPYALFRSKNDNEPPALRFVLKGGTDAAFAPPLDYTRYVFLPVLQKALTGGTPNGGILNQTIDLSLVQRGFYPKGGGQVHMTISRPSAFPLAPIRLVERGSIVGITIRAFASGNCPLSMVQTLADNVQNIIASNPHCKTIPISIDISEETSDNHDIGGKKRTSGCGVLILAETKNGCLLGGTGIASPKIPLEETARLATQQVIQAIKGDGCVDDCLQDQLIIYMALAGGVSEIVTNSLTMHTKTAIWLASKMLPSVRFQVTRLGDKEGEAREMPVDIDCNNGKNSPGCHRIRCYGIGFCPPSSN